METIKETPAHQVVYWRNRTAESDSLMASLASEDYFGNVNTVDSSEDFYQALKRPHTQLIVTHDPHMSDELLQKIKSDCPNAVVVVVCQDENKLPLEVRKAIHHILNTNQLDKLGELLKQFSGKKTTDKLKLGKEGEGGNTEIDVISFLNELQDIIWTVPSIDAVLEQAANKVVPMFADICVIDVLDDDELIRRAAFAAADEKIAALSNNLKSDVPIFSVVRHTAADALRSKEAVTAEEIPDLAEFLGVTSDDCRPVLSGLKAVQALAMPMTFQGRSKGLVTLVFLGARRCSESRDKDFLKRFAAMVGSAVDHARLEHRVKSTTTKLKAVSVNKDAFLGTLSHELRTPLQAMLGWTQLMRSNHLKAEDIDKALDALETSIRAQGKIVNDLLDLSRINSGKLNLIVRPCALAPLLEDALAAFEVSAGVKTIDLSLNQKEPDIWISADTLWLQRAFWNILSNSVKFTPQGGNVTLETSREDEFAVITFTDNGEGIEPAHLPKVFEYFSQAEAGTTRVHEGLGIGMVISRFIIEAHGGSIAVHSLGKNTGSTFTVRMPRCEAVKPAAPSEAAPVEKSDAEISLVGVRMLIVEDEKDTRELLRFIFEQAGAHVVDAPSAKVGMAKLVSSKFDILVSDIGMPQEDGLTFIGKVRALPESMGGDIPALALTAFSNPEDRVKAIKAGFQLYTNKPVDIADLLHLVKNLYKKNAQEPRA